MRIVRLAKKQKKNLLTQTGEKMSDFSYAHHTVIVSIENPESLGKGLETHRALLFSLCVVQWNELFERYTFLS